MSIGSNIRKHRDLRGLKQAAVAKALDVTVGTVSHWETGNTTPSAQSIIKLARFYDIDVSDIFEDCDESEISDQHLLDRLDKLTLIEWTLVDGFRALDKDAQDLMMTMLGKMLDQPRNLRKNSASKPVPA